MSESTIQKIINKETMVSISKLFLLCIMPFGFTSAPDTLANNMEPVLFHKLDDIMEKHNVENIQKVHLSESLD